jgi:hypothetical protein
LIGRAGFFGFSFASKKQVHVKEKHDAEVDGKATEFETQFLDHVLVIVEVTFELQDEQRKADVHEVETHLEEAIGSEGNFFSAVKDVEHKYFSIFKQRFSDKESQEYCNRKVNEVSLDGD